MASGILAYIHCRRCVTLNQKKNRLEVGLLSPTILRVWCSACELPVGDFTLAVPLQPRCDICGELAGPNHTHN